MLLLVGKPGSGKSTIMKQLIVNEGMYKRKFDDILIVSPSYEKLKIEGIKKEKCAHVFTLDFVFG